MEITLDRSEFMALAALTQAQNIIGLDAATLLPATAEARQALYDQGEASLRERALLQVTPDGVAVLEENLLRLIDGVTHPDDALVAIKTVPGIGQQLFLYYGKDQLFVEQTLPTEQQHRLADVGDINALVERLLAVFPVSGAGVGQTPHVQLPQQKMIEVFQLAIQGRVDEARQHVSPATPGLDVLLADFAHAQFSGTLAIYRGDEDGEAQSSEIALVQGQQIAWIIAPAPNAPTVLQAQPISAPDLAALLARSLT